MGIDNRNPILIMFTIIVLEEGGGDIIYIARVYISHDIWCVGGICFYFLNLELFWQTLMENICQGGVGASSMLYTLFYVLHVGGRINLFFNLLWSI